MVIAGHSLYCLLWLNGTRSGATPSLYMSWVMPAALGFAEIEGELPTFHHGNFSKKCHTMVIADHITYRRLWPVGAQFGATPSLCMSQEMPDVLGLLKLAGKRLKYSTFMSIILQIRKFILTINQCSRGRREATAADNEWGLTIGCAVRRDGVRRN
jgi:hypothetical protein